MIVEAANCRAPMSTSDRTEIHQIVLSEPNLSDNPNLSDHPNLTSQSRSSSSSFFSSSSPSPLLPSKSKPSSESTESSDAPLSLAAIASNAIDSASLTSTPIVSILSTSLIKMVDQVEKVDRGSTSPVASIRSNACFSATDDNSTAMVNSDSAKTPTPKHDNNNNSLQAVDQHTIGNHTKLVSTIALPLDSLRNISSPQSTPAASSSNDFESLAESKARSLLNGCVNDSSITLVDSNNNEFTGKCLSTYATRLCLHVNCHFPNACALDIAPFVR